MRQQAKDMGNMANEYQAAGNTDAANQLLYAPAGQGHGQHGERVPGRREHGRCEPAPLCASRPRTWATWRTSTRPQGTRTLRTSSSMRQQAKDMGNMANEYQAAGNTDAANQLLYAPAGQGHGQHGERVPGRRE